MSFSGLATRYVGQTAEQYDLVRAGKKWDAEHAGVEQLLTFIPQGSTVLDVPVGTGRLFRYFNARNFDVCGADISADMLAQAKIAARAGGGRIRLSRADIRSMPFTDEAFDLVVCLRFLNMVDGSELELALKELSRLSRDKLLIGIRYITPYSDLRPTPLDAARVIARPVWLGRWLYHRAFGNRSDVVAHQKRFLYKVLGSLELDLVEQRFVERRWDSTDYVLWLLRKVRQAESRQTRARSRPSRHQARISSGNEGLRIGR